MKDAITGQCVEDPVKSSKGDRVENSVGQICIWVTMIERRYQVVMQFEDDAKEGKGLHLRNILTV